MKLVDYANVLPFHAKAKNCELTQSVCMVHGENDSELAWQEAFTLIIQQQALVGAWVEKLETQWQARVGGCRGELPLHAIAAGLAQQGLASTIRP